MKIACEEKVNLMCQKAMFNYKYLQLENKIKDNEKNEEPVLEELNDSVCSMPSENTERSN